MNNYNNIKNMVVNYTCKIQEFTSDICIFIPSHIKSINQIKNLIKKTIPSLINQKHIKCNIYLSISFENNKLKKTFIKLYTKNKEQLEMLTFIISSTQKYQVEHIQSLFYKFGDKHKYIMFCDDDDTYNEYRLVMFDIVLSDAEKSKNPYAVADLVSIDNGDDLE
jgi:hypothetical protein